MHFKVGAVAGWNLDLSPQNFRGGVSVFCVREGKGIHTYLGYQTGEIWEIATYLPVLFPAGCGHVTKFWQIESELK